MRPTPNETVAGVVRILRDTVAPAVTDAHARAQLTQAIAVLRAIDAQDAVQVVHTRAAETELLLDACAEWAHAEPTRVGPAATLADRHSDVDGAADDFTTANDRYEHGRAILTSFIVALACWRETHGPTDSADLHRRIGRVLAGDAAPEDRAR